MSLERDGDLFGLDTEIPPGLHIEWAVDPGWKVIRTAYDSRRCRRTGRNHQRCSNMAVAALRRNTSKARCGYEWFAYCPDHLYGRRIIDGVVKVPRLVKNEEAQK